MFKQLLSFMSKQLQSLSLADKIILAVLFGVNTLFCIFKSNPVTLSFYEMDSYSFLQKLVTMYEGVVEFNPVKHVSYGYYNYGYAYFLDLLVLCFPFLATNQHAIVIFISRFVSVLTMLGSVLIIQRWLSAILSPRIVTLSLLTMLCNIIFFKPGILFYPDWTMTFFVILALYYQFKAKRVGSTHFWLAMASFGIAIGVKFQAIIYAPFLVVMVFLLSRKDANGSIQKWLNVMVVVALKVLLLWGALFIVINPFILHPKGLMAFMHRFEENMTRSDKSLYVYLTLYVVPIFYLANYYLAKVKVGLFKHISFAGAVLLYLVFQFNHYFFTKYNIVLLFVCIITVAMLLKEYKMKLQQVVILALCLVTLFVNGAAIKTSIQQRFFYQNQTKLAQLPVISQVLSTDISANDHILMTSGMPVDYLALNIPLTHIHFAMAQFLPYHIDKNAFFEKWKQFNLAENPSIKPFHIKKYIVINKKDSIFGIAQQSKPASEQTLKQLRQNKWNYATIYESADIIIFKYKGQM